MSVGAACPCQEHEIRSTSRLWEEGGRGVVGRSHVYNRLEEGNQMKIGDRVRFKKPSIHYHRGWPKDQVGIVISHPYELVWLMELENTPGSRIPVLEEMIEEADDSSVPWPREDHAR